jgi:hypothetical protein
MFLVRRGAWYYPFRFFVVFADSLNAFAVGAPFDPGLRIRSPEPALIRFRLAWMFLYNPDFMVFLSFFVFHSTTPLEL